MLTPADLEEWVQDPELFHHEQDLVQFKDKLRPCAESLYLALFESHREVLFVHIFLVHLCSNIWVNESC